MPQPGDLARRVGRDLLALELHGAGLGPQVAGGDVEKGGLAGAVGADDGELLALDHVDVDVVGRHHAAEADDEAARLQEDLAGHRAASAVRRRFHMPISPFGANRMMAISTRPRMSCQVLASLADA